MESIAEAARCNIRMLYHYFGSKEGLYLACLEHVYTEIRERERELSLLDLGPLEGITKLVHFTFDHMHDNQDFVQIAVAENLQGGHYLEKLKPLSEAALGLIATIETLLRRGQRKGIFKKGVDAVQLYVSILSLSYLHLSNRHTLSINYATDLGDPKWISARRAHVTDMVLAYLQAADAR